MKIIPDRLKKGDRIGIISTARKIRKEELESAIMVFKNWGLEVVFGKYLFSEYNQFAGSDSQRAYDLQSMILDTSVKAIMCARGGYGTVRIIDQVDFSPLLLKPKWIIGYSDVTVLHSHLANFGIASMHATMPINFSLNTAKSIDSLYEVLFSQSNKIICDPHELNVTGTVQAEIMGGNLSILCSLLGSISDIKTKGKILFIEDLDEYLYHIDRMIMTLKRAGKLSEIKALIVGSMHDMNDNEIPFGRTAYQIISDYTKEYSYPKCFNFPSGHLNDNRSIIFGKKSVVEIGIKNVILQQ